MFKLVKKDEKIIPKVHTNMSYLCTYIHININGQVSLFIYACKINVYLYTFLNCVKCRNMSCEKWKCN